MKKITAIICTLALLTAFTGCNNGETSGSVPAPESEDSGDTKPVSEPVSNSTPSEPEASAEDPTFLKGPAGDPIYPTDITYADISGGRRITDISELTEDNLAFVQCDNFVYLKDPMGISYNRYESPEKFESEFPYLYIGEELVNQNPVKRVYVGEKICGMTVTGTGTSFVNNGRNTSVPFWNDSIGVTFKGEVTLTGYLSVEDMTPDYPGTEGAVTFGLDEQSSALPITDLSAGKNGAESSYYNGTGFYSETCEIKLGSIYGGNSANCDEALLDGITYGDKDIHVKITIDDYSAFGYGDNRAVLKSLERL